MQFKKKVKEKTEILFLKRTPNFYSRQWKHDEMKEAEEYC